MSKKNKAWFIKVRGSYLPNSWQAWLLYVPFVVFLVGALYGAWHYADSAFEAVYFVIPQLVCAGIIMTWIASKKSK